MTDDKFTVSVLVFFKTSALDKEDRAGVIQAVVTLSIRGLLSMALARYCDGETPTVRLNVRVK
jgi:hypothetical protein